MVDSQQATPMASFESAVQELRETVVRKVDADAAFYRRARSRPRNLAATVAGSTIVLGAAIPLLAALDYSGKQFVVSLVGVVIAALTSLGAYYRWADLWRGYLVAWNDIEDARARWELDIIAARRADSSAAAMTQAFVATDRLLEAARQAIRAEQGSYFAVLGRPASEAPGAPPDADA